MTQIQVVQNAKYKPLLNFSAGNNGIFGGSVSRKEHFAKGSLNKSEGTFHFWLGDRDKSVYTGEISWSH